MKNIFKKNTDIGTVEKPMELVLKNSRRSLILNKVMLGMNIATLITTPVAIKMIANNIDDTYAKKALYTTGGLLWIYQLSDTINNFKYVKLTKGVCDSLEEFDALAIEIEGENLMKKLSEEEEV